jgi:CheY-like chemotaxis protein
VRSAVTKILESAGYTVLAARDGVEALEILAGGAPVRLVLLDVVMPPARRAADPGAHP